MASGPTSSLPPGERRQRRQTVRALRLRSQGSTRGTATLLLFEPAFPHRLTARSNCRWSRALARLLAPWLDRRLVEGKPPESHLLLAARAHALVMPARRQSLAYQWDDLLAQARRPPQPRDPRSSLNRDSIVAHEPDIRALLDVLVAPTPGPVRGIATLSWLLTDGTGPLYNHRCSDGLGAALRDAAALLDPSAI